MKINNRDESELYLSLLEKFKSDPNNDNYFLDIIDFINKNEIFFDSKLFLDLFDIISINEKNKYWKLLIDRCTVNKIFDIYEIKLFVNSFIDMNDKLEFITLLINSSFFPVIFISDVVSLLVLFEDKKFDVLDLLFDNEKIRHFMMYQIKDLFSFLPENERKEMLYYLRKKVPDKFDDASLLCVLQLLEPTDIITVFNDLVINDDNFNEKVLFESLDIEKDVNLTFYLLDLYVCDRNKKYNDEDKKKLFEKLKRYIVDFGDFFCEEYPSGEIVYNEINNLVCQEYGLNVENFQKFVNCFGYDVFQFLDCINVRKLINLDTEKFMKVINLFNDKYTILDQHTLNNVLNAFYQREFLIERNEDYMLFGKFEELIKAKNKLEILKEIKKITEKVDVDMILLEKQINFNDFIEKLLENDKYAKDVLHFITNKYLTICRREYVIEKLDIAHLELNLVCRVEKNMAKKMFYKCNSIDKIIRSLSLINKNKLSNEQIELLNNHILLEKAILYKINPNSKPLDSDFYKTLSHLEKMTNILWENGELGFEDFSGLEYVYYPEKVNKGDLLGILAELDIDQISKRLLDDDTLYNKLLKVLDKYKILGWGKTFDLIAKNIDLVVDSSTFATLINYFYAIDLELSKNNNNSLTKMIVYANCYESSTNKFAYLFGQEDYRLLCANAGNYKAPAPKNKRLELAVLHLKEMYEKNVVTIPSYEKNYSLKNGKIANVVVGNSTSIKNLTVGERTDSCLRICGLFYELFKFVIKDKNGFNLCFYDQNNSLISRVSGVRFGNTIFLNQLRNSLNSDFKNSDLQELITLVCDDLLEMTKNSEVPIDNVVISSQEALKHLDSENQYIGEDVFREGLYNLPFNYDTDGFAYLLASRELGKFINKKISTRLPEYKCCSDKIIFYDDFEQANNRFIQFSLINQLLNGKDISEMQIPNEMIKSCISCDKFIIARDFDDEIIVLKLDKYKDDLEIDNLINELLNKYVSNKIKGVNK